MTHKCNCHYRSHKYAGNYTAAYTYTEAMQLSKIVFFYCNAAYYAKHRTE